jgi:hypothetical protein
MNWLHYLVEANLYISIFYLFYCLFLTKETHYTLNRTYLLFACVISFILPLLQIGILKSTSEVIKPNTTVLPAVNTIYVPITNQPTTLPIAQVIEPAHFTLQDALIYIYLLGVTILLVLLTIKLYRLFRLSRAEYILTDDAYKLIYLENTNTAFSFFNYLFIGTEVPGVETIMRHEQVHIKQRHSFDIILLELIKIMCWFNPLIYLLQNSLKTVHEYIADEQTAANENDALAYSSFLIDNAYGVSGASVTHSFFNYNLLKKRIIMLNQERSGRLTRLKYLIILPLCAALICVSTLGFSKTYGWVDLVPAPNENGVVEVDDLNPSADTVFLAKLKPYVNKKGFLIDEKYYAVNSKKYFRTIISARNGKNLPNSSNGAPRKKFTIYLGQGNASGEEMLFNVYGYKLPNSDVTASNTPIPHIPVPVIESNDGHTDPLIDSRNKLSEYASEYIKYPKEAILHEITGTVVAEVIVNKNNKIAATRILKSVGYGYDEEVVNMLKSYPGIIKGKYSHYAVSVGFQLFSRTKIYPYERLQVDPKILNGLPNILGMVFTEYGPGTPKFRNVPPPPPPMEPNPLRSKPEPPKKVGMVKFPPPAIKPNQQKPVEGQANFPATVLVPDPKKSLITADGGNADFRVDKFKMFGNASGHIAPTTPTGQEKKQPLIVLNEQRYDLKEPLKPTQQIYFTATDSVVKYEPTNVYAQ